MKSTALVIILEIITFNTFGDSLNVLFMGNSFTYYYDIPKIVQNLASEDGEEMTFVQRTPPGWNWKQQWESKETLDAIRSQVFDAVIMQDQSRGLADTDEVICNSSFPYANNLVKEVRKYSPNAVIQLYQTWGYESASPSTCAKLNNPYTCDYETMQDRITEGFNKVACQLFKAKVAPVGEAFRYIREKHGLDRFKRLYQADPTDDHQSEEGAYLSACVHYNRLFNRPCLGNPYYIDPLTAQDAKLLQEAADKTVASRNWDFHAYTCNERVCD